MRPLWAAAQDHHVPVLQPTRQSELLDVNDVAVEVADVAARAAVSEFENSAGLGFDVRRELRAFVHDRPRDVADELLSAHRYQLVSNDLGADRRTWLAPTGHAVRIHGDHRAVVRLDPCGLSEVYAPSANLPLALRTEASALVMSAVHSWGAVVYHASLVSGPAGDAVLAVGPKGAGKSSFGLMAGRLGYRLLSDECAYAAPADPLTMVGIRRRVALAPEVAAAYGITDSPTAWIDRKGLYELAVRAAAPVRVRAVVAPVRRWGMAPEFLGVDAAELASRLWESTMASSAPGGDPVSSLATNAPGFFWLSSQDPEANLAVTGRFLLDTIGPPA